MQVKTMNLFNPVKINISTRPTTGKNSRTTTKDFKQNTSPEVKTFYFKARSLQAVSCEKPQKPSLKTRLSKAIFSYNSIQSIQPKESSSKIILKISIFKERPAVVLFDYPSFCNLPSKSLENCYKLSLTEAEKVKLRYKFTKKTPVYNCILNSLEFSGFSRTESKTKANLILSALPKSKSLKFMNKFQKVNHFPGSWCLGRKDSMWKNIWKKRREFGEDYNICPTTYILPEDFKFFQQDREDNPGSLWIKKPVASSCGRGIKMVSSTTSVERRSGYLISRYISNPHTIKDLKYDLRIYVLVTSFDPLRIYFYQEGLVRFATQNYSKDVKNLKKRFIHLTNYSVNKKAQNYISNQGQQTQNDTFSYKWPLSALKSNYEALGINFEDVMQRVKDVVIKTIIAVEPEVVCKTLSLTKNRATSCFELYGFDILIDSDLKPWLLEVNVAPSLSSGSALDKQIKTSLMCDIYTLVGLVPFDRAMFKTEEKRNKSMNTRTNFKNYSNVLNSELLTDLSEDEVRIIAENQEEMSRLGRFQRIFPLKENALIYEKYFEVKRVNNALTWKSMMVEYDVLDGYLTRVVNVI
jgi:tubulin polyglutamylase TTLL4